VEMRQNYGTKGRIRMKTESLAISLFLAAGLVCAAAGPAQAQEHSAWWRAIDISAGYSYVRTNSGNSNGFNVNGGSASAAYNLRDRFVIVADAGAYHFSGLPNGISSTMYSYLFGPRINLMRTRGRLNPFVQALFGVARLNSSTQGVEAGENSFAMAFGGGLDIPLHGGFAIRAVEADYLVTRFSPADGLAATQNNVRISAGLVIRFGGKR